MDLGVAIEREAGETRFSVAAEKCQHAAGHKSIGKRGETTLIDKDGSWQEMWEREVRVWADGEM